eukprot:1156388-Pelagomonas_calceolata.AAC.5
MCRIIHAHQHSSLSLTLGRYKARKGSGQIAGLSQEQSKAKSKAKQRAKQSMGHTHTTPSHASIGSLLFYAGRAS